MLPRPVAARFLAGALLLSAFPRPAPATTPTPPTPRPVGPDLIALRATRWSGLQPIATTDAPSGRGLAWHDLRHPPTLSATHIPRDWGDCDAVEITAHLPAATADALLLRAESPNLATEGADGFEVRIPLDWSGWRTWLLPRADFVPLRHPSGWDAIERLAFEAERGPGRPAPGTRLSIGSIRLVRLSTVSTGRVANPGLKPGDAGRPPHGWTWDAALAGHWKPDATGGTWWFAPGESASQGRLRQVVPASAGHTYAALANLWGGPATLHLAFLADDGSTLSEDRLSTLPSASPSQQALRRTAPPGTTAAEVSIGPAPGSASDFALQRLELSELPSPHTATLPAGTSR